ncbi:ATP-binding protein [Methylobacterium sp. GC_Met_2]|uniref:ATP-binding protein n=1 Tax=Methylobacterium sp. GC_Met_2 TaxID=2937376 RepID=UPI00226B5026
MIRYANRIVIKNAGYSLKSPDRFSDPGSSIRNPNIAAVLHETRFAETKGSGIRVMQTKMQQRGLAAPTFESNRETDEFTATFLFHHFLDERDLDWLSKFIVFDLAENQMKALIFVREVGAIDNATYRSLCTIDTLGASRNLRTLTKLGLLTDRGSGVRTHYVAGPEMIARDLVERDAEVMDTIHDSDVTMDGAIHGNVNLLKDMPLFLRTAVRNAQFKRRLVPEEGRLLIEALCQWRPLSLSEIADLIGKTPTHVSQKYLTPMVASQVLEYSFPEMPQHPEQKYKASKPRIASKRSAR